MVEWSMVDDNAFVMAATGEWMYSLSIQLPDVGWSLLKISKVEGVGDECREKG
jgi:hypothetical protein